MAQNPNKVVEVAKSQVGYLEKKSNSDLDSKTGNAGSGNYTKYGKWYGVNPALWCAQFVCWCFAQAYGSTAKEMLYGGYSAACETMRSRFIKAGRYDKNPKVGSCIFFSGTRHAGANHIGIVTKVTADRVYTTEGNTSGASGVIDNGGGVANKSYSRNYSRIMGYGHPDYDVGDSSQTTTSKPLISETAKAVVSGEYGNGQNRIDKLKSLGYSDAEIKEIQAKVNELVKPSSSAQKPASKPAPSKSNEIDEDGEWGVETTRAAQKVFGTPIDGIVSRQIMKYHSKYLPNCLSSSWKFYETPSKYKGGSALIKAIQDWLDVDADGLCGPATVEALQEKLGVRADKVMGEKTVTAFQKYLNRYL